MKEPSESLTKLIVWGLAFVSATILVALGKAPHEMVQDLIFMVAGALGHQVMSKKPKEEEDEK